MAIKTIEVLNVLIFQRQWRIKMALVKQEQ